MAIEFVEAGKQSTTDANGEYDFGLAEGAQSIIFSKIGYFSDTLQVTIAPGATEMLNVALMANLADLGTSSDSLTLNLPADTVVSVDLVIRNDGPSGVLQYSIEDLNGPLPLQPEMPSLSHVSSRRLFDGSPLVFPEVITTASLGNRVGDTLFIDPIGDLVFGDGGDLIAAFGSVGTND
ncbi:MAG: carboxypeptidase-like regulatory domain-containing protein, partial [Calditrichota bacterium]